MSGCLGSRSAKAPRATKHVSGTYPRETSLGVIPDAMRITKAELLDIEDAAGTVDAEARYLLGQSLVDDDGDEQPDLLSEFLDRQEQLMLLHAVRALRFFATETACVDNPLPPLPKHRGWDLPSLERWFNLIAEKVKEQIGKDAKELDACLKGCQERAERTLEAAERLLETGSIHICRTSRFADLGVSLTNLAGVCRVLKMNPAFLPRTAPTPDA